jgi:FdhD protein
MDTEKVPSAITKVAATKFESGASRQTLESVITEEPLEIRVATSHGEDRIAVTMRTPGNDLELAAGFVLGEGVVSSVAEITKVVVCGDRSLTPRQRANVVIVHSAHAQVPTRLLDRRFVISSACGVCGVSSIAELQERIPEKAVPSSMAEEDLISAIALLKPEQKLFEKTGGLHAAGIFLPEKNSVHWVREDVGRHNAVDKSIGAAALANSSIVGGTLLFSGRIGFEIVQKAAMARLSAIVGVSAPTSMAIDTGRSAGITIIGFAREGRGTRYC